MTLLLLYRQWRRQRRGAEGDFVCLPGGESHAGLGRELFGRLGRMALHTLVLAIVLFFVVPRLGQTTWCGAVGNPRPLVGYSDTVKLGELGEIVENGDESDAGAILRPRARQSPAHSWRHYLQGAILMTYDKGTGRPDCPPGTCAPNCWNGPINCRGPTSCAGNYRRRIGPQRTVLRRAFCSAAIQRSTSASTMPDSGCCVPSRPAAVNSGTGWGRPPSSVACRSR